MSRLPFIAVSLYIEFCGLGFALAKRDGVGTREWIPSAGVLRRFNAITRERGAP